MILSTRPVSTRPATPRSATPESPADGRTSGTPRTPGADAQRALHRMRRYTTASMVGMVGIYALISAAAMQNVGMQIAALVCAIFTIAVVFYWEGGVPRWVALSSLGVSTVVWTATMVLRDFAFPAFMVAVCVGVLLTQSSPIRWSRVPLGLIPLAVPIGGIALITEAPVTVWTSYAWFSIIVFAAALFLFGLNRYGWNRYLEIDAARRTGEELAVAQERYRFAADLHDIQGHTLHVLRLKIQLADRLVDSDPVAAHTHLAEAQLLIAETVANTRNLAFGERQVAVASELANARELFLAAGIRYEVHGDVLTRGNEELFGLVIREATTNILRHSQATTVAVRLGDGRVVITNDGSPHSPRELSGLARLGDRFAAVGGSLAAGTRGGLFTTEASIALDTTAAPPAAGRRGLRR